MRRSAGVRRRRRGRVSGKDIAGESSLTLALSPGHDQRRHQRLGRRRRGHLRVRQAGRASASAVVGPMTAIGLLASAVAPQRARNARSADGLANVAASNAGSGGRSATGTVSETGTTSTTKPRASSCGAGARGRRPPAETARACRPATPRAPPPVPPGVARRRRGPSPRSAPRPRARARSRARPPRCAPPPAPASRRRARPAAREPHRGRAGQHDPAVIRGARRARRSNASQLGGGATAIVG